MNCYKTMLGMSNSERGEELQISNLEVLLPISITQGVFITMGCGLLVGDDYAMVNDTFMCLLSAAKLAPYQQAPIIKNVKLHTRRYVYRISFCTISSSPRFLCREVCPDRPPHTGFLAAQSPALSLPLRPEVYPV